METTTLDGFLELYRGADESPKRVAPGETLDSDFQKVKAIEVRQFRLHFSEEYSKNPSGSGSSDPNPPKRWKFSFEIKKLIDSASAPLFRLYCESLKPPVRNSKLPEASCTVLEKVAPDSILKARVHLRKGGGQPFVFMTLRFACVAVHAYEVAWEDDYLVETVKFNAKRCRLEYHPQLSAGHVREQAKQSVDRDFSKTDG